MFSFWKTWSSRGNTYQSQQLDFPSEPWPQNGFLVSNELGLCAPCPWGSWQTGWKSWPQNGLKTVLKRLKAFAPKRATVSQFAGIDLRLGSRCNQIVNQAAKRQISHPPKSENWSMMFHHDSQRTISWFPFTLVYHKHGFSVSAADVFSQSVHVSHTFIIHFTASFTMFYLLTVAFIVCPDRLMKGGFPIGLVTVENWIYPSFVSDKFLRIELWPVVSLPEMYVCLVAGF